MRYINMSISNLWSSKQTDHERFELLVRPHVVRLYKLAYRLTGQRVDADDLIQDVMLKLYPRLTELQSIENLSPWLSRILYHQFIDQQRRVKRSPVEYTDDEDVLYSNSATGSLEPTELLESDITQKNIQNALEKLNPEQRIVLLLHDIEGYTLQEIQYIQDVSLGTLKSRLHRSRNKLRELLNKMEPFTDARRVSS
ncbi:MAG: RNA polymerase sigma factor [endosymbiont of Galathealinum brachiosum]|uniref:RNA polymerase sigma factor n=1 Tax=endosymbiont of Galathealinum brachiosum TaxID=2200906 RepID=A0A370D6Q8_9GAMM|nr:MAG: RNA polymerase sigma factor [endosymbiont of Galathealinum brachiosum]